MLRTSVFGDIPNVLLAVLGQFCQCRPQGKITVPKAVYMVVCGTYVLVSLYMAGGGK